MSRLYASSFESSPISSIWRYISVLDALLTRELLQVLHNRGQRCQRRTEQHRDVSDTHEKETQANL
jgi:hypothetical protein